MKGHIRIPYLRWTAAVLIALAGVQLTICDAPAVSIDTPAELVAAHTAGVISRTSTILVQFSDPLIPADRMGIPLPDAPLSFAPPIAGQASWSDPRRVADHLYAG